jgi:signal transduction histidine kinase
MARIFVAARAGQLAFSALMVAGDRRRYRQPWAQVALLAAAAAEGAWLGRRVLRAGRYEDSAAMWADTVFSAAGLLTCEAGLRDGEGAPWMKNIAIGAALGTTSSQRRGDSVAAMAVLSSAAALAGLRAGGRDAHVAGPALAANDIISWIGMSAAARIYVESHRRSARLRDAADALAVERAAEAASQDERARQQRRLHRVTVDALHALAGADDRESAARMARHEAARLRHALRTRGDAPSDLDARLCDIAEAVAEHGIRVELVTVEHAGGLDRDAADAVGDAVLGALIAAHELGQAERAVVRAVTEEGRVAVTVRHHGAGFKSGDGSLYEARLAELAGPVRAVDGHIEVWSAPGRGVRVTVDVPASREGDVDNAPDGLPLSGSRRAAARDDDRVPHHRHVERRSVRRLIGAAEDEARTGAVHDGDVGAAREATQAGVEQRQPGDDANRGGRSHTATMAPARHLVVGRTTPFPSAPSRDGDDEDVRAERTILAAALTWRFTGIATGLAAFAAGRERYRNRRAPVAALALAGAESIWMAARVWRKAQWSPTEAITDATTATALLVLGRANLAPADRQTWLNWAPWSFAANAVAFQALGHDRTAAGATGGAAITAAAIADSTVPDAIATTGAMAGFFTAGRLFAHQIRSGAARLTAARGDAVRAGITLAAERERVAQLRLLHDGALQTLETMGSGRFGDLDELRALAAWEAARLQAEIEAVAAAGESLRERINAVVEEHRRSGLVIDLTAEESPAPSPIVARAIADACNEALTNVRKHAGTGRAVVMMRTTGPDVEVVIADSGRGFDPEVVLAAFGRSESIAGRLAVVGGRADITSVPGEGTTVTLRGPSRGHEAEPTTA